VDAYLADEPTVEVRRRSKSVRYLAGAMALVAAGTLGYVVGKGKTAAEPERLSGSTLFSCQGLPSVLVLQLSDLDPDAIVQAAVAVGRTQHLVTPDGSLLHGLHVDSGVRPDTQGRIELVQVLAFSPPNGDAEVVVYEGGSLSDVVQRRHLTRLPCAGT
jgi:hypothetical protein